MWSADSRTGSSSTGPGAPPGPPRRSGGRARCAGPARRPRAPRRARGAPRRGARGRAELLRVLVEELQRGAEVGERVVDLVRDAGGDQADRREPVGLHELDLHRLDLGDVEERPDEPDRSADPVHLREPRHAVRGDPADGPVRADDPVLLLVPSVTIRIRPPRRRGADRLAVVGVDEHEERLEVRDRTRPPIPKISRHRGDSSRRPYGTAWKVPSPAASMASARRSSLSRSASSVARRPVASRTTLTSTRSPSSSAPCELTSTGMVVPSRRRCSVSNRMPSVSAADIWAAVSPAAPGARRSNTVIPRSSARDQPYAAAAAALASRMRPSARRMNRMMSRACSASRSYRRTALRSAPSARRSRPIAQRSPAWSTRVVTTTNPNPLTVDHQATSWMDGATLARNASENAIQGAETAA